MTPRFFQAIKEQIKNPFTVAALMLPVVEAAANNKRGESEIDGGSVAMWGLLMAGVLIVALAGGGDDRRYHDERQLRR